MMKISKPLLALPLSLLLAVSLNSWSAGSASSPKPEQSPEKILMDQARSEIKQKNYDVAIGHLDELLAQDSDDADVLTLLGYSHRKLKKYTKSEKYYNEALSIEPDHKGALEYLGELYVETDRMSEAVVMLEKLDAACFFTCSEYRDLKNVIESARSGQKSAAVEW